MKILSKTDLELIKQYNKWVERNPMEMNYIVMLELFRKIKKVQHPSVSQIKDFIALAKKFR